MSIARVFVERLTDAHISPREVADLDVVLAAVLEKCRHAWPTLEVDARDFVTHVAHHLSAVRPLADAVQAVHAADLYLAFACASGDSGAIGALEATYGGHIDAVLASFEGRGFARDDLRQMARDKLFVADATSPPRIARYSGQGSFAAWLRVTVRRAALNAVRGTEAPAQSTPEDDLFAFPQSFGDPELDYLKQTYREAFREAFLAAVAGLSTRERTLLRQSVVHGLNVRQIGRMYGVHHGTAARWVAQARAAVVTGTREALARRLEVSERELESIMALIESRLEVSVARALRR